MAIGGCSLHGGSFPSTVRQPPSVTKELLGDDDLEAADGRGLEGRVAAGEIVFAGQEAAVGQDQLADFLGRSEGGQDRGLELVDPLIGRLRLVLELDEFGGGRLATSAEAEGIFLGSALGMGELSKGHTRSPKMRRWAAGLRHWATGAGRFVRAGGGGKSGLCRTTRCCELGGRVRGGRIVTVAVGGASAQSSLTGKLYLTVTRAANRIFGIFAAAG